MRRSHRIESSDPGEAGKGNISWQLVFLAAVIILGILGIIIKSFVAG
jgi:hypothetical protein